MSIKFQYDNDMVALSYQHPANCARMLSKYFPDEGKRPDLKLLDLAAGTGRVGLLLKELNFTNITAVGENGFKPSLV